MRKLNTNLHIKYSTYSRAVFWPLEQSPLPRAFCKLEQNGVQQSLSGHLSCILYSYGYVDTEKAQQQPQYTHNTEMEPTFGNELSQKSENFFPVVISEETDSQSKANIQSNSQSSRAVGNLQLTMDEGSQYSCSVIFDK